MKTQCSGNVVLGTPLPLAPYSQLKDPLGALHPLRLAQGQGGEEICRF